MIGSSSYDLSLVAVSPTYTQNVIIPWKTSPTNSYSAKPATMEMGMGMGMGMEMEMVDDG